MAMRHEHEVMTRLARELPNLPHYVKSVGLKSRMLNPSSKCVRRPWEAPVLFPIETVEMEYLHESKPLYDVIARNGEKGLSVVIQIMCANALQWEACRFTHYDLHAGNILCVETDARVHVYQLNSQWIAVRTHGVLPKIIDFGFSHVANQETGGPLGFSEYGFLPFIEDSSVDLRFLLCSLTEDVQDGETLKDLVKGYKEFSKPLLFNPKRGWIALDVNIEDYVAENFPTEMSAEETSIFGPNMLSSTVSVLLAHSLGPKVEMAEEKFQHAWSLIESSLMSPFTELLTVVTLIDMSVEEAKRKCFWLRSIEESTLIDAQHGLWNLQHLLQPILKEAQSIALESRVEIGSSTEWFFSRVSKTPMKWKEGDVVRQFPEGKTMRLTLKQTVELNRKWKTTSSLQNWLETV